MRNAALVGLVCTLALLSGPAAFAQMSGGTANAENCPLAVEPGLVERFQAARRARAIEARPIYGCDDRRNLHDPKVTAHQKRAAQATAILVRTNQLRPNGATVELPKESAGLCSPEIAAAEGQAAPERFWDEPAPGFCSGFKVGPRRIATAGHCIENELKCRGNGSADAPGTSFVFGFALISADARPEQGIRRENVYRCVKRIGGSEGESDWAVVEVDRDIDAPQVTLRTARTTPKIAPDVAVTVIGYPIGLPLKVADNARVRELDEKSFIANLDTYGGNSGSAVFNTGKLSKGELLVEGILVSGSKDFLTRAGSTPDKKCFVSRHCSNTGCSGERVTRISEIAKALGK